MISTRSGGGPDCTTAEPECGGGEGATEQELKQSMPAKRSQLILLIVTSCCLVFKRHFSRLLQMLKPERYARGRR
jgi:hypothetical protein